MIKYTIEDYLKCKEKISDIVLLNDISEEYELEVNNTHQYHDKIFKKILDNKEEFLDFLKRYTKYEEEEGKIKASDLIRYNRNFITKSFSSKVSDIIYKLKNKNVFFLIEHQRVIDYKMPKRIAEYCIELIRDLIKEENVKEYPYIIPIVLYTGKHKWNVQKSMSELHKKILGFEPVKYPNYNLVNVNDYTDEELISENTAISKAMLFEKQETDEEILEAFNKIFKKELTKREKECLEMILNNFSKLRKTIGKERVNKLLEKIEEKGEVDMEALERFFIHMFQKEDALEEKEGKLSEKEGKLSEKEGKLSKKEGELAKREKAIENEIKQKNKEGIMQIIKKMVTEKIPIEVISKITGFSEAQIRKIK